MHLGNNVVNSDPEDNFLDTYFIVVEKNFFPKWKD